jgi:soluble lytic murein transglycosylase-like protein
MGAGGFRVPGARYSDAQLVEIYGNAVRYFNRRLAPSDAQKIASIIISYSRKYGLDARLVMAVIAVESNFNQNAVSPVGAMGLGQLMPGTANDLGVRNAYDANANLEGSTRLLSSHIRNMTSDGRPTEEAVKLALACYNAGAGAVKKYKGIPPYRETQNYVAKITRLYQQMCGQKS